MAQFFGPSVNGQRRIQGLYALFGRNERKREKKKKKKKKEDKRNMSDRNRKKLKVVWWKRNRIKIEIK